jgi:hypothetical protein
MEIETEGGGGVTTNHRWKLSQWPLAAVELREWRWWSLGSGGQRWWLWRAPDGVDKPAPDSGERVSDN